jgi:hypothetical protein
MSVFRGFGGLVIGLSSKGNERNPRGRGFPVPFLCLFQVRDESATTKEVASQRLSLIVSHPPTLRRGEADTIRPRGLPGRPDARGVSPVVLARGTA